MRVFVPAEARLGEKRVAILPRTVSKFAARLLSPVQRGAWVYAFASDADYVGAGAMRSSGTT